MIYPIITHTWVDSYQCMYDKWVMIHPSITHTRKYCVNIYPYCVGVKIYSIFTCMGKYLPTYNIFTQYLHVWLNIAKYLPIYKIGKYLHNMCKYCLDIYPYHVFPHT